MKGLCVLMCACLAVTSVTAVSQPHYDNRVIAEMMESPLTPCDRCETSMRFCFQDCYNYGPPGTNFLIPDSYDLDLNGPPGFDNWGVLEDGESEIALSPVGPPGSEDAPRPNSFMPRPFGGGISDVGSPSSGGEEDESIVHEPSGSGNTELVLEDTPDKRSPRHFESQFENKDRKRRHSPQGPVRNPYLFPSLTEYTGPPSGGPPSWNGPPGGKLSLSPRPQPMRKDLWMPPPVLFGKPCIRQCKVAASQCRRARCGPH